MANSSSVLFLHPAGFNTLNHITHCLMLIFGLLQNTEAFPAGFSCVNECLGLYENAVTMVIDSVGHLYWCTQKARWWHKGYIGAGWHHICSSLYSKGEKEKCIQVQYCWSYWLSQRTHSRENLVQCYKRARNEFLHRAFKLFPDVSTSIKLICSPKNKAKSKIFIHIYFFLNLFRFGAPSLTCLPLFKATALKCHLKSQQKLLPETVLSFWIIHRPQCEHFPLLLSWSTLLISALSKLLRLLKSLHGWRPLWQLRFHYYCYNFGEPFTV